MKKVIICLIFLVVSNPFIFGQTLQNLFGKEFGIGESPYSISFEDRYMILKDYENNTIDNIVAKYDIENGIIYATLLSVPIYIKYFKIDNIPEKWLILHDSKNILLIYDTEKSKPLTGGPIAPGKGYDFGIGHSYYASTELKEKNTVYNATNLEEHIIGVPWVMADKKDGIGQSLRIVAHEKNSDKSTIAFNYKEQISGLWISIGFVSYDKPGLYSENSRPKQIIIKNNITKAEETFILQDTPNLQYIKFKIPTEDFTITIKQSYPGTKYHDCAINTILTNSVIIEKLY